MIKRLAEWYPVVLLLVAVIVLFHRLFLGEVLFWGVPLLQFYPWREMAFDLLRSGQLPLWNPLVGHGAPLLANYQTAAFYPPNWLYLVVPTEYAMGWVGALHVVWAGLGMLAYLRRLGVDRLGQSVGALAYALSGYMIGRFGFLTITSVIAWLPWLLWGLERLAGSAIVLPGDRAAWRRVARAFAAVAAVVAMQLLAGHAQTSYYSLVYAAAYTVWMWLSPPGAGPDRSLRRLIVFPALALGAVLLGTLVAMAQIVPTYELMQQSQRAGGVDYRAALSYSFWPWHLLTLALPGMFGSPAAGDYWGYGAYWEDAVYTGLLTLALAIRAVMQWARRTRSRELTPALRAVPFLALSVLPVTALALGWNTPLYVWLFRNVPTFDMFNGPARWMVLVVFALSALGGIGADRWRADQGAATRAQRTMAVGVALLMGALGGLFVLGKAIQPSFIQATARLGISLMVIGLLVLALRRAERSPRVRAAWEIAAAGFLALDLVMAHWGLNPTIPASYYHQITDLADVVPDGTRVLYLPGDERAAKFDLFLSFADLQARDRAHWDRLRESLLPNLGMLDDVPGVSNFDPLLVGRHADLLARLDDLPLDSVLEEARRLNVGVVMAVDAPLPAGPRGQVAGGGDEPSLAALIVEDPWPRAVLADCAAAGDGLACERLDAGSARIVLDEANRVAVATAHDQAAWLLLLDTYYPGWQAAVDGEPVDIRLANTSFRAVRLPAGDHTVEFSYRPRSVRVGAALSGAGLVILALILVAAVDRRQPASQKA